MTRITFVGEDFWTAHLADGLNSRFPEEVRCTAIRMQRNPGAFFQLSSRLLRDDVLVRVGFPPTMLAFQEYDEARYAHRSGTREHLKRLLFRTTFGRAVRKTVLFLRTGSSLKWRAFAEWLQQRPHPLGRERQDFIYWIGTDVLNALNAYRDGTLPSEYLIQVTKLRNITGVQRLTDELAEIGIRAETVPYPGRIAHAPERLAPMPDQITVLTYIPDFRRDFYGWHQVLAAARRLPDVRFVVMGGSGTDLNEVPSNIDFVGFVQDPQPLYDQCSIVLRHVAHDGAGYSMVEDLLHARQVIYTYDVPHVIPVPFGDEKRLVAVLKELNRICVSEKERFIVADSVRQDVSIKRETQVEYADEGGGMAYRQASVVEVPYLDRSGEPLARELRDFVEAVRGERAARGRRRGRGCGQAGV